MLKSIIISLILFASISAQGQTYFFNKLEKIIQVETSYGDEPRVLNSQTGNFRLVFEQSSYSGGEKLFTVLKPGQSNAPGLPWYGYLTPIKYLERNGKTYEMAWYYDSANDDRVIVAIALDYSSIIIFQGDDSILQFTSYSSSNHSNYTSNYSDINTTIKTSSQLWREPIQTNPIRTISKGTKVKVIGYKKGFWKVNLNGTIGYVHNETIYNTYKMHSLKNKSSN